jgi:SNF2 family DNA or RNA helicase
LLSVDPAKFKTPAYQHQIEGVEFLVNRPYAALFDQPGVGKSKQVVDAACLLFIEQEISGVVVVCPAGAKRVWTNLRIGEVAKHVWVDSVMNEWDSSSDEIRTKVGKLTWTVVSYECLRVANNVTRLMKALKGRQVLIVADESIKIKGHKSQQTVGALRLRQACNRAYILNGTPTGGNPLDLYCQMEFLSPQILRCDSFYQFRNRHAIIQQARTKAGKKYPTIIGYTRLEVLKNQIKPYAIRRLRKNCLDLPQKIYYIREVPFTESSWAQYKEMRDRMIVELSGPDVVVARQAIVKNIRLRQLTSGFIGGLESTGGEAVTSSEKMDFVLDQIDDLIEQEINPAIIIWVYFTFESEQYYARLKDKYPTVRIRGGIKQEERNFAEEAFNADSGDMTSGRPVILLGQPQAGGLGLTLTRSHHVFYSSQDYNLVTRIQSEDRVDRPGQLASPNIYDVLVTGPQGQRTIDHVIYKALKTKDDMATWTAADWVRAIGDESPEEFLF